MTEQNHYGSGHNINARDVFIDSIPKLTSDLTNVVNALSKRIFFSDIENDNDSTLPFDPEEKIRYNNIVRFKSIIDNYKSYVGKLSSIYDEFDSQGTSKTHFVLENIKLSYLKEKGSLIKMNNGREEIEIIRESADDIIERVEKNLLHEIKNSSNIEASSESINLSLQIVLIDAFIRCKILEKPS